MQRRLIPLLFLSVFPAHAVIIRGHVLSPLGAPQPGARVQLIQGQRSVGDAITGIDGEYEIRSDVSGRFILLTSASISSRLPAIQIGSPFYGGRADLLNFDIALDSAAITPQVSSQSTLRETPLAQQAIIPIQIRPDQLLTHATLLPELRPNPGAYLVQEGPNGTPSFLYLRGAAPAATKTVIDGISAEDLGGSFNLSTLSTSALSALVTEPAIELSPTANPLYALGAEAGVLSLHTPFAQTLRPTVLYTGDAGNLASLHNEVIGTLAHTRTDLLASFARFDTSNDTPATPFHVATYATNLGYHISAATSLRLTLRDDFSAGPPTSPIAFYGVAPSGRFANQDLYSGLTFETRTEANWHNLLRFGIARKRNEQFNYTTPLHGLPVTITGANGSSATGIATFLQPPPREDRVTNRDEYTYQTDYPFAGYLTALLTFRYVDQRAADLTPNLRQTVNRTNLSFAVGVQGQIRHRFFYETSGFVAHSPIYGFRGSPRVGLTYAPVRPGIRAFRGTTLHVTAATGFREPSLVESLASPTVTPRSRTFDASIDQNLLSRKLTLQATYFHNQFSHDFEPVFLQPLVVTSTLAFRTQGLETHLRYQPLPRLSMQGSYTYLAALTTQSLATPATNPSLPGTPIGALTALPGARPFHRPPHTGFLSAEYTGTTLTASVKAALSSRSDDSTYLIQNPTLLLPNRDLSPGWLSLDASVTYALTHRITAFTQLTNITDNRHIAPISYASTPFLIRTGLRIRIGGE